MAMGAVWVLVRFVLVLAIVRSVLGGGILTNINLLWVGSLAIAVAVMFATAAFMPDRHAVLVPILRIASILSAISDIFVVLSGSHTAITEETSGDLRYTAPFIVSFTILVVDLLIAAALISYRPVESTPRDHDQLPPYSPTDVEDQ